jgi:hypothetical protein
VKDGDLFLTDEPDKVSDCLAVLPPFARAQRKRLCTKLHHGPLERALGRQRTYHHSKLRLIMVAYNRAEVSGIKVRVNQMADKIAHGWVSQK